MTSHQVIDAAVSPVRKPGSGIRLVLPAICFLALCFVMPVLLLLLRSLLEPHPGLENYREVVSNPTYRTVLLNTFEVATVVTVVSLLLSFPIAWFLVIIGRPWATIVLAIVILSMWTNLLARTFAWMVLLQTNGLINKTLQFLGLTDHPVSFVNNLTGIIIGMTYIMLPFIIMPLYSTMKSLDPAVFRACELCGGNRWQIFRLVFIPSCSTGIASGCLMVFIMSLGYFITPSLLGGAENTVVAQLIAELVQSLLNWGLGSAAAVVLVAVTFVIYLGQLKFLDPLKSMGVAER